MTGWIVIDYESASAADLKEVGADRYWQDPTTEILVLTGEAHDGRREQWLPDQPMGPLFAEAIAKGWMFVAHNARFERAGWREHQVAIYGWPHIPIAKWHDTMAKCAMLVLPQKLEQVLPILRIPALKDTEGSKLTISLSRTNRKGYYPERTPEMMQRIYLYNENDITSQVALHKRVGWLPPGERRVWELDQLINDRGVMLDQPLVRAMRHVVEKASRPLEAEFSRITGGLKMGQIAKVKEWCEGQGFDLPDMKKETLDKLLGTTAEGAEIEFEDGEEWMLPPVMSPEVRRVLHIRQLIGSASIKKLGKMEQTVCYDGRAHGLLQYHGAGPGRWAGRLLQPQNFPRGSVSKKIAIDDVVAALMSEDLARIEEVAGVPPVETVVSSLRYAITAAPGKELCVADFAQIEARVLLALAGQWDKVDLFATGADIYCDMASQIYRRTITKENPVERQTGKNSVLGLGFGMGPPKFHFRYAQDQPLEFCQEVVRTYRKEWAPKVPPVWYALEAAAAKCVHTGLPQEAYGVVYEKIDLWLTALLPSGRRLWYFNPQPVWTSPPWDASDLRMGFTYQAKKQNRWLTISAYGALLCENVVQALARDLMVEAAYRAEANGFPIVLTVHDELVTEPDTWCSDYKALEQMMSERSPWATAMKIPVAAEGWQGDRYRK